MIYSGSDQVYNTRDEKWRQRGRERHEVAGRGECQASAVGFPHFTLWIEEFLFDQTVGWRSEFNFLYFEFELKAFKVSKQGNWAHFKSWQENFGMLFWLLATANPFWQCGCLRRQKAGGTKVETAILTFIPFWITLHWFKILKHNLELVNPRTF